MERADHADHADRDDRDDRAEHRGPGDRRGPGALRSGAVAPAGWRGWTRWPLTGPLVALAALTVAVDVVTAWADVAAGHLGRVPVSPALPLGLALALGVGLRRLGWDRANRRAWREFLAVGSVVLVGALAQYAVRIGGPAEAAGLVIAALGEELVYRLAVLVLVGAVVAWCTGRNWRNAEDWGPVAGVAALLAGGLVFTLLPGHLAQVQGVTTVVPFASLGVVLGYAVLRTGALLPAVAVHALVNVTTIAALTGAAAPGLRTAFVATALVALVAATVVAGRRLGLLRPVPAAIDLRATGSG